MVQYQKGIDSRTFIDIEWQLINICNYECSYCNIRSYNGGKLWNKLGKNQFKYIPLFGKLNKPLKLSFLGGEPTMHPRFEKIIDAVKKTLFEDSLFRKENELIIFSNFSDKSLNKLKNINPENIKLVGSYHAEQTSNEQFLKTVTILNKLSFNIEVNLMIEEESIEIISDLYNSLKKLDIVICARPIYKNESKTFEISDEILNKFKDSIYEIFILDDEEFSILDYNKILPKFKFKGATCYNNLYQLDIKNILTRECSSEKIDLNDEENYEKFMNIDDKPLKCEFETCGQDCLWSVYKCK